MCPSPMRRLLLQKPEDQRHDPADDEAGHDREIETELATLDDDVSGQSAKPEPTEPRPQQPDHNEYQTDPDEPPSHDRAPAFPASNRPRASLLCGKLREKNTSRLCHAPENPHRIRRLTTRCDANRAALREALDS